MEMEVPTERAASCCEKNNCVVGARVKLLIALDEERCRYSREQNRTV